uniref:Brix domain containing 2 n=1 Tax=Cyprinus carpio TaxID=7962 RepID=A0A8C1R033_CYPCA
STGSSDRTENPSSSSSSSFVSSSSSSSSSFVSSTVSLLNCEFIVSYPFVLVLQGKWRNKERVRVFCSRGISFRTMMPHSRADKPDQLFVVNEVCEIKNCNTCIFSEAKQQQDLNISALAVSGLRRRRLCVFVVHTLAELKMTGNCLKEDVSLVEIGPRFVLNLIIIFQGSLGGPTLYENPHFLSPNTASTLSCTRSPAHALLHWMVFVCSARDQTEADVTEDVFLTPAEPKQLRLTELKKKTRMKHKGLR